MTEAKTRVTAPGAPRCSGSFWVFPTSILVVLSFAFGPPALGQPPPVERVERLVAALESHDMEEALGCFHSDFVLRHGASSFETDREGLRRLLEWDFATHSRIEVESIESRGETVVAYLRETNDFYRLVGMPAQRLQVTYRFADDGRILEQVFLTIDTGGPTLEEALEPVLAWMAEDRPEDLDRLYRDGVVATGETADDWIALLKEWRRSTQEREPSRGPPESSEDGSDRAETDSRSLRNRTR